MGEKKVLIRKSMPTEIEKLYYTPKQNPSPGHNGFPSQQPGFSHENPVYHHHPPHAGFSHQGNTVYVVEQKGKGNAIDHFNSFSSFFFSGLKFMFACFMLLFTFAFIYACGEMGKENNTVNNSWSEYKEHQRAIERQKIKRNL